MYAAIEGVEPLDGYKLRIKFNDGVEGIFDVTPYLSIGKFAELKDPSMFSTVKVKFDSIEWANQLDIDPEFLYEKSVKIRNTK